MEMNGMASSTVSQACNQAEIMVPKCISTFLMDYWLCLSSFGCREENDTFCSKVLFFELMPCALQLWRSSKHLWSRERKSSIGSRRMLRKKPFFFGCQLLGYVSRAVRPSVSYNNAKRTIPRSWKATKTFTIIGHNNERINQTNSKTN